MKKLILLILFIVTFSTSANSSVKILLLTDGELIL